MMSVFRVYHSFANVFQYISGDYYSQGLLIGAAFRSIQDISLDPCHT